MAALARLVARDGVRELLARLRVTLQPQQRGAARAPDDDPGDDPTALDPEPTTAAAMYGLVPPVDAMDCGDGDLEPGEVDGCGPLVRDLDELPDGVLAVGHDYRHGLVRPVLAATADLQVAGEAASGDAALALVKANDYDIAMLDMSMPGLSGIELCRRLRGAGPCVAGPAWPSAKRTHSPRFSVEQPSRAGVTHLAPAKADARSAFSRRPALTAAPCGPSVRNGAPRLGRSHKTRTQGPVPLAAVRTWSRDGRTLGVNCV